MNGPPISKLISSAEYFLSVVTAANADERPDVERIVDGYLDHKRTLAITMEGLVIGRLGLDDGPFMEWRTEVTAAMAGLQRNTGVELPANYMKIRGFTSPHPILYAYLARHAGQPITGMRLRVLTGDQVHTERRVRDLRSLGLHVSTTSVGGEEAYLLDMDRSSSIEGARAQLLRNLKEVSGLPIERRMLAASRLQPKA